MMTIDDILMLVRQFAFENRLEPSEAVRLLWPQLRENISETDKQELVREALTQIADAERDKKYSGLKRVCERVPVR